MKVKAKVLIVQSAAFVANKIDNLQNYVFRSMHPVELYSIMRNCLAAEVHLVSSFATDFMTNFENLPVSNYRMDILEKLDEVKIRTEVSVYYSDLFLTD